MQEITENDDLGHVWDLVLQEYQEITKENLKMMPANTIAEVMAQITESKSENHANAKKYFSNVLNCIDKFGSAIADTAGNAFPGAGQCFNAISLVIRAIKDYQKIFEGFAALMEISAAFLARLQNLLTRPNGRTLHDKSFLAAVYDILRDFLLVLAQSYKLTKSKTRKAVTFLKVLCFSADEGVAPALERMKQKIARLTQLQIDDIMYQVSDVTKSIEQNSQVIEQTNNTVNQTNVTVQDRAMKDNMKDAIQEIREVFNIERNTWDDVQDSYKRHRIEGTGEWLTQKHGDFCQWADATKSFSSRPEGRVIFLEGESGVGKSYICSNVIDHLIGRYPIQQQKVFVAYYFFRDGSTEQSSDQAIKAFLLQLAQSNAPFAEALAKLCRSSGSSSRSSTEIWDKMTVEFKKHFPGTVYFVLDGLDEDECIHDADRPLQNLIDSVLRGGQTDISALRLLISGNMHGIRCLQKEGQPLARCVHLGPIVAKRDSSSPDHDDSQGSKAHSIPNRSDMIAVIKATLDNLVVFNKSHREDLKPLKALIPNKLLRGVRGSFSSLMCKLDEIKNCGSKEDIEAVLERADEDISQFLMRELDEMDKYLSQADKEILNEILAWVIGLETSPSCTLVQAALLMKFGKTIFLRQQIPKLYSAILVIYDTDDIIVSKYEELKTVLFRRAVNIGPHETKHSTSTGKAIMDAEIQVAQRLLRTFCGEEVFNTLGFDEFFAHRSQRQASQIHIGEDTLEVRLLRACLESICEHYGDSRLDVLRDYAFRSFHLHLRNVVLEKVSDTVKIEIGSRLVRLLRELRFISEWWTEDRLIDLGAEFTDTSRSLGLVIKWLQDPTVQGGLQSFPGDLGWVRDSLSDEATYARLLESVLLSLRGRFLAMMEYENWTSRAFLKCHYKIYAMVHGLTNVPSSGRPTAAHLEQMKLWSCNFEMTEQIESQLQSRLGRIICHYGDRSRGLSICRNAMQSNNGADWLVKNDLILALQKGGDSDKEEALKQLEELREKFSGQPNDVSEWWLWYKLKPLEASCNRELHRVDVAAQLYNQLIHHNFENEAWRYVFTSDWIEMLVEENDFPRLVLLLRMLSTEDLNLLQKVIEFYATYKPLHQHLIVAAADKEAFLVIKSAYEACVLGPERKEQLEQGDIKMLWLNSLYAKLLKYSKHSVASATAIQIWEDTLAVDFRHVTLDAWDRQLLAENEINLYKHALDEVYRYLKSPDPTGIDSILQKTVALVKENSSVKHENWPDVHCGLARLFHMVGQAERAGEWIREYLADPYRRWMTNQDTSANYTVYLRSIFQVVEDSDNLEAALDICLAFSTDDECANPGLPRHPESGSSNDDADDGDDGDDDDDDDGNEWWSCDGDCRLATRESERWLCRDCPDTDFEVNCFTKLRKGLLPAGLCGKDHHFHHYKPADKITRQRIRDGEVRVGDVWMSHRDWFARVNRSLGLSAATTLGRSSWTMHLVVRAQRKFRQKRQRKLSEEENEKTGTLD